MGKTADCKSALRKEDGGSIPSQRTKWYNYYMKININKVKTMGQTKVPLKIQWKKTFASKPAPKPRKTYRKPSSGIGVGH